jgi:natural product biosynthesis luciferase-like monooxygenase protein
MSEIKKKLAALSPAQRDLLASRFREKMRAAPEGSMPISPTALTRGDEAPSDAYTNSHTSEQSKTFIQFSLYFFSDDGSKQTGDKYRLLLECARFADLNGFSAVWTPERHFQDFGGLYPNPSVLSAALAMVTKSVQIRAGSVALPLHHPVRVAEEWSVVDNLSGGRVAVSFASGWHPSDFILSPENYEKRKEIMYRDIETVRRLWAGEAVTFGGVGGVQADVTILPRPLQPVLPVWVTSSGSAETWIKAGEVGANVLSAFISNSPEELAERIALYRESRARHGHDSETGVVTLMLHTFVGEDDNALKEKVRPALSAYLLNHMKQYDRTLMRGASCDKSDMDAIASFAFEQYFADGCLLGTPAKCSRLVDRLIKLGVDEIACLVDFGLDTESVLSGLRPLGELKDAYSREPVAATSV